MELDVIRDETIKVEAEPDINVGGVDGEQLKVEVRFNDDEDIDLDKAHDFVLDTFGERGVEIDIDLIEEKDRSLYYEVLLNRYYD